MFDGSFKSKRAISLGGNKQQADKQKLLRQAQEERRIREAERKRLKAAENIQAWYRGRTVAIRVRQELRTNWDRNTTALYHSIQSSIASPTTTSSLSLAQVTSEAESAVQNFLIFYRSQQDHRRLVQLCKLLLLSPVDQVNNKNNLQLAIIPFQLSSDHYTKWQPLVGRVLPLLVKHLNDYSAWPEDDSAPVLTVVELFTAPESFQSLQNTSNLSRAFAQSVLKSGGIAHLARFVGRLRVTKMSSVVSNAYMRVITMLLGMIPLDSIEPPNKKSIDDDEDMEWMSEGLPGTSQPSTGNLDPRISKWLSLAYDSNHLNDILGSIGSTSPSGALSSESVSQITHLLLNLITLFPSHKINILSNLMYFRFGSKSKQSSSSSSSTESGKIFGVSIIKIFMDAFMATPLYGELVQSIMNNSTLRQDSPQSVQLVHSPAHGKSWSLLAFLSELYCQILVTMGDDEFHDDNRNPICLSNVTTLCSVVRDVAFLLWWNDNSLDMNSSLGGSMNLKVSYLRDIVTKLTRQLHARDSRKQFCPKDHWLLSMQLDMSAFRRAVIQDEESLSRERDMGETDGDDTVMTDPNSVRERRSINRRQKSSQLARLSPRLGVLNNIPFVIRFEDRVAIFREFIELDRRRTQGVSMFHPGAIGTARVRRGYVFEDGYEQLNNIGSRLKGRISISFIDQYGIQEAGIDGGGVFKEFLTSLVLQAFDTNYGLFMNTSDQLLYPNPHSYAKQSAQLKHYEFLGRILGKALYEGILVDAAFAGFFLSKCLGQINYLDDLPSLDPELYRGLMHLKNYDGNVEDLELDFTVADEELGQNIPRNLVPNGSNIPVTKENRIRYIYLVAHYRLNTQIELQCRAFFHGLSDLIDPKWLWMFNQQELQVMLGGAQTPISLKDLEQNVVYSNFKESDPTIEYFWSVVQEMKEEDRRLLVKFITSCARPPLLGFGELNPKLCIRNAGQEEDRLPTSSTCMNLLKLPAFTSRQRLKEKLLYAIHSEAGFDLS
ncbi:hypothetical protein BGZ76_011669 [Entomortierella beljakovae]|nr:hypothetical protein BGZ76_011669 [Entomortierella beljakovae]